MHGYCHHRHPYFYLQLKIYNPHKKALLISSINLADAGESGFRINLDGMPGKQFADVEIAGQDSLYIFVEATLPQQKNAGITLIRDSILFQLNGIRQEVKLWAYAQDAYAFRGKVIEQDTLIASERPILIYDSISVAPNAHLTLAAGTRLYFHGKAGMQVHGRLSAEGTLSSPVVFRGDRTDRMFPYLPYDRLPGHGVASISSRPVTTIIWCMQTFTEGVSASVATLREQTARN